MDDELDRNLTYLLRHSAARKGFHVRKDGFVLLPEVIQYLNATEMAVMAVVQQSIKREKPRLQVHTHDGVKFIRATNKVSMTCVDHALLNCEPDYCLSTDPPGDTPPPRRRHGQRQLQPALLERSPRTPPPEEAPRPPPRQPPPPPGPPPWHRREDSTQRPQVPAGACADDQAQQWTELQMPPARSAAESSPIGVARLSGEDCEALAARPRTPSPPSPTDCPTFFASRAPPPPEGPSPHITPKAANLKWMFAARDFGPKDASFDGDCLSFPKDAALLVFPEVKSYPGWAYGRDESDSWGYIPVDFLSRMLDV